MDVLNRIHVIETLKCRPTTLDTRVSERAFREEAFKENANALMK